MIANLKPYPVMKDSGVEWLGEVPQHWEVLPLGRIGRLSKGNGGTKADDVSDGVPCIRYGDLYTKHEFFIQASRSFVTPERSADYTPIRLGDVLFAASGETIDEIGKSAVNLIESQACCGGDVIVLRPWRELIPRFMGYASDCPHAASQKARMGRGITVMHIYGSHLKYLRIPLPFLAEQVAVVRLLDYVDRRVRRYIRAKQTLIRLLKEQRQAIIHRAVTRGLDPDVPFKPSGVEWLGDVPAHWDVVRLGRLLRQRGEMNHDGSVVHVLSLLRDRGVIPYDEKGNIGNKKSEDITRYKIVRPDDIVVNCMNVIIGSVGLSPYMGCLSPVYYVFACRGDDQPRYLDTIFQCPKFHRSLVRIGNGILAHRMRIPMELLKCELLPRPPIQEQTAIVEHLDKATVDSDAAIDRARREVELLREYRTRLIADVVTGKLDVREAAANLPDEPDEPESLGEADGIIDEGDAVADDPGSVPDEVGDANN